MTNQRREINKAALRCDAANREYTRNPTVANATTVYEAERELAALTGITERAASGYDKYCERLLSAT